MLSNTTHTLPLKDKVLWIKTFFQHKLVLGMIKLSLAAVLVVVLYHQLFGREDLTLERLGEEFIHNLSFANTPYIILVVLLMPLNWFFETQKWLSLMQKIEPIALSKALKSVLIGLTFSLFTPNRVGEYGGRVLMVSKGKRFLSVFATMVGISSQWIVLIVGGWWGLMGAFYLEIIPIAYAVWLGLVVIGLVATIGLLFVYFNVQRVVDYCLRLKWTRRWAMRMRTSLFDYYTFRELNAALFYSTLRYLIYSVQYLLLLYFFGFEANFGAMFLGILIVYLLQTGIPLPPSTGLLARGNIALLIFGYLNASTGASTAILASTFSLWIINVLLPALLGAFFIARLGWDAHVERQPTEASLRPNASKTANRA